MRAGGHTEKVWRVLFQVVWAGGRGVGGGLVFRFYPCDLELVIIFGCCCLCYLIISCLFGLIISNLIHRGLFEYRYKLT